MLEASEAFIESVPNWKKGKISKDVHLYYKKAEKHQNGPAWHARIRSVFSAIMLIKALPRFPIDLSSPVGTLLQRSDLIVCGRHWVLPIISRMNRSESQLHPDLSISM